MNGQPSDGHQFHFVVKIQGAHREGHDGPYVDEELWPDAIEFKTTVRAWNLSDACRVAAERPLPEWMEHFEDL